VSSKLIKAHEKCILDYLFLEKATFTGSLPLNIFCKVYKNLVSIAANSALFGNFTVLLAILKCEVPGTKCVHFEC